MKGQRKLSPDQRRDLDVEISFLERLVQRDPKYIEALQVLGADYSQRGNFAQGLKIDRKLARLKPNDPTILYNLACSYSLTRQFRQATLALNKAIEFGFDDYQLLMQDPDLDNLRRQQSFDKIRVKLLRQHL